jgi:magnesium transporter
VGSDVSVATDKTGLVGGMAAVYWAAMAVTRAVVHHAEGGFDESPKLESISDLICAPNQVVWLDIQDPSDGDIELLRAEFGFHELALEDVTTRHQRPKIDAYDGYYFMVFYRLRRGGCEELNLFIGEHYLVTIHNGDAPEIAATVERWRQNADRMEHDVAIPVYSLLDAIVDGYFPVIDEIAEEVEDIENSMFGLRGDRHQGEIFRLKRELLNLRRILAPEREVLNILIRRDEPILGEETLPYFQDVYDHVIRVLDTVDLNRDQLSGLLEAHLSVVSNRLNMIMKRMTALATVLMSVTLIASIYGMNFDTIPELHWGYGYPYALGLMLIIGTVLTVIFKRIDWL